MKSVLKSVARQKNHLVAVNQAILFFCLVMLFTTCSKSSSNITPPTPPVADKQITSFTLTRPDGSVFDPAEYSVNINTDSVKIILPPLISRNGLKATLAISGQSVSPANGAVMNFSTPINYTVTAQNGSTRHYTVEAAYAKPTSVVFIGAGNKFYALDAVTGAVRWSYTGGGSFAYSSATYKDNVIYVGCVDSYVYAFNASNGRLLWKFQAGTTGIESDAVIADSTVYVGSNDDILFAIDAVTGLQRWSVTTGGNISSSPKIENGKVYFGSSDGKLYAVQALTGQPVWQYQTGGALNQSGASLVNGNLYVGSRDGYLYSINAATGTFNWRYDSGTISLEQSSPTVYNGVVYIGGWYNVPRFTLKGSVYAVDASNGNLIWEKLPNIAFSSSPFVNNDRLSITGDDGKISVLQTSTGNLIWQKTILANSSSPVEANGIIYVGGGGNGFIYAFNADTGAELWKFPIPGALITSSPVVIELSGDVDYPGDSGAKD